MHEETRRDENGSSVGFTYTYSSSRKAEIEAIRRKYLPKEEDSMERLRRLDRSAAKKGAAAALSVGVVSCLVMGTGMSLCMVWTDTALIPGIAVGLIGMAGVAAAYPLYTQITRRERERIAPEILRLTQELLR